MIGFVQASDHTSSSHSLLFFLLLGCRILKHSEGPFPHFRTLTNTIHELTVFIRPHHRFNLSKVCCMCFKLTVMSVWLKQPTSISEHSCLCEAPVAEMHRLDCQCKPAGEGGHFACDCWATQDPEPAQYLDCLEA